MATTNRKNVKAFAAIIGGSAIVTIGALSTAIVQQPGTADQASVSPMTVGATSTETTPPTVPAVPIAKPAIKGPVATGF